MDIHRNYTLYEQIKHQLLLKPGLGNLALKRYSEEPIREPINLASLGCVLSPDSPMVTILILTIVHHVTEFRPLLEIGFLPHHIPVAQSTLLSISNTKRLSFTSFTSGLRRSTICTIRHQLPDTEMTITVED